MWEIVSNFVAFLENLNFNTYAYIISAVFSGGARAPPEFRGSQKGQSLISAYQSLAITRETPGFEKLNTALTGGMQVIKKTKQIV